MPAQHIMVHLPLYKPTAADCGFLYPSNRIAIKHDKTCATAQSMGANVHTYSRVMNTYAHRAGNQITVPKNASRSSRTVVIITAQSKQISLTIFHKISQYHIS